MGVYGLSSVNSPAVRKQVRVRHIPQFLAVVAVFLALIAPAVMHAPRAAAEWAAPRTVYIPETGQSVDGYFLDVWRSWGIANLGYPISPEVVENGIIVQYYQYARMEYWPDDPNGDVVKFGKIGLELKPVTMFRSIPSVPGIEKADERTPQLNLELRAWLPVDNKIASKPDTASWRFVEETRHTIQHGFKDFWEATGEADYLGFPVSEEYVHQGTTYQVFERGQLAWTAETGVSMMPAGEVLAQRYRIDMSPQGQGNLPLYSEDLFIPPPEPVQPIAPPDGERVIEINLSTQYLIAWQGGVSVGETYVSTGKPGFDTPPGTYQILYKLESQTMEGVLGGEYYNVPDVPWVMYFTGRGHALHGTYWHNNFGAVMSHGCVNMPVGFAEWLYNWAPNGGRVEIHY
ncbi:L,D-transpeptidase [soil metagenome]